jgi:hypothetical protein
MSYDLSLQRGEVDDDSWPVLDEQAVRAAIHSLGDVEDTGEELYWQPPELAAVFYLFEPLQQIGIELHAGAEEGSADAEQLLTTLIALAESQQARLYDPQCDSYVSRDNLAESLACFTGPDTAADSPRRTWGWLSALKRRR